MVADDFGVSDVYRAVASKCSGNASRLSDSDFRAALEKLKAEGFSGAKELIDKARADVSADIDHGDSGRGNDIDTHFKTYFRHCRGREGDVTPEKFVDFCETMFGRSRRVAIKFMKNEEQWRRERSMRGEKVDGSGKTADDDSEKLKQAQYVVRLMVAPSGEEFRKAVETFQLEASGLAGERIPLHEYKYGIVMPAADRTLDAIYRAERPDLDHVRVLMKDVGEALEYLHEKGIVHGDLKMQNIIRVDGKMQLIDLDAATRIGEPAANKFSSAVLPPELLYEIDGDQKHKEDIENHWAEDSKECTELWKKVGPKTGAAPTGEKLYGVRTFKTIEKGSSGKPVGNPPLPYDLVSAAVTLDVWSFGIILYTLLATKNFMPVTRDFDLVGADKIKAIVTGNQAFFDNKLKKVNGMDPVARDLLMKIFKRDPRERLQTMTDVLVQPFFSVLDQTRNLDGSTDKIIAEIRKWASIEEEREEEAKRRDEETKRRHEETMRLLASIKTDTMQIRDVSTKTLAQVHHLHVLTNHFCRNPSHGLVLCPRRC